MGGACACARHAACMSRSRGACMYVARDATPTRGDRAHLRGDQPNQSITRYTALASACPNRQQTHNLMGRESASGLSRARLPTQPRLDRPASRWPVPSPTGAESTGGRLPHESVAPPRWKARRITIAADDYHKSSPSGAVPRHRAGIPLLRPLLRLTARREILPAGGPHTAHRSLHAT